jgi:hypothetical protein
MGTGNKRACFPLFLNRLFYNIQAVNNSEENDFVNKPVQNRYADREADAEISLLVKEVKQTHYYR